MWLKKLIVKAQWSTCSELHLHPAAVHGRKRLGCPRDAPRADPPASRSNGRILATHDPRYADRAGRTLHILDGRIVREERRPSSTKCVRRGVPAKKRGSAFGRRPARRSVAETAGVIAPVVLALAVGSTV
jgi:hypothetical protein